VTLGDFVWKAADVSHQICRSLTLKNKLYVRAFSKENNYAKNSTKN